jgi:hypothetical protein
MVDNPQPQINKGLTYSLRTKPTNQKSSITSSYSREETDAKFKDVNYLLLAVVIILLLMVATLVIDSFHINSATYKEYSQKTESVEITQKANEALLKQVKELFEQNKNNQTLIIKPQK